jgi:DNA-binding response OmpR family regulator
VNAGKSSSRLLVIDSDTHLVQSFVEHFEGEGYQVVSALTGHDGLARAQSDRPNVILLSARLDDMAGLDVFRKLRDMPRTSHVPVMILAGRNESLLQNTLLEEGAYDFIDKPVDIDILGLRVRNALRRAEREGLTEPRTGLPSDRLIHERLSGLETDGDWFRMDLTVAQFNVFRDLYGFVTANEALRFAGNLIAQIVNEHGTTRDFVGHYTNTEDFIVITALAHGPKMRRELAQRVTRELESFYNFEERDRGYVLIEDGAGGHKKKPLMSLTVAVQQSDADAQESPKTIDDGDHWVDAVEGDTGLDGGDDSPFDW